MKLLLTTAIFFITNLNLYSQYCLPSYTFPCSSRDIIDNINFASINNDSTGCNGNSSNYIFDTSDTAHVNIGGIFPFTLESGIVWKQFFGIWIDYNNDGDFNDINEFVASSSTASFKFESEISIPIGSSVGTTRLRIRSSFFTPYLSNEYCALKSYGETEDYAIVISPQAANDIGVLTTTLPDINCGFNTTEELTIRIQNSGTNNQYNIPVSYQINGGAITTDIITDTIFSSTNAFFTLPSTIDLSAIGTYSIKIWTDLPGDQFFFNDTLTTTVEHKCYCIPEYAQTCDTTSPFINDVKIIPIGILSSNTGCSINSNNYSIFPNDTILLIENNLYTIVASLNPGVLSTLEIGIDQNKNFTFEPTEIYTISNNKTLSTLGQDFFTPSIIDTTITQMRLRSSNVNISTTTFSCDSLETGETEDYIVKILPKINTDVTLVKINLTKPFVCATDTAVNVKLQVYGSGNNSQTIIPVALRIDGAPPIYDTITTLLFSYSFIEHTFSTPIDLSSPGIHTIDSWIELPFDGYSFNDSIINFSIDNSSPVIINSFPHIERFEGQFPPLGWEIQNNDNLLTWEQNFTDNKTNKSAHVNLIRYTKNYLSTDDLITPIIDLSNLAYPAVRFDLAYAQFGFPDTLEVIVANDCGETLQTVYQKSFNLSTTSLITPTPWVPSNSSEWRNELIDLNSFVGDTNLRLIFRTTNVDGNNLYIDNIEIIDRPLNDLCVTSDSISFSNDISVLIENFDFANQETPASLCNGSVSVLSTDLWYNIEVDSVDVIMVVDGLLGFDPAIEVFDSCFGNLIACANNTLIGESEFIILPGNSPGVYQVRVYHSGNQPPLDNSVNIYAYQNKPPKNDECTTAIPLIVDSICNPIDGVANGTASFGGCAGDAIGDVWYSFIATQSTMYIKVDGYNQFDAVIELYENCSGNSLYCIDNSYKGEIEQLEANNLTIGQEYFIRVYDYRDEINPESVAFNICVSEQIPTGIKKQTKTLEKLVIYPNPSESIFNIELNVQDIKSFNIQLLNINGKEVYKEYINTSNNNKIYYKTLDLSNHSSGIYLIKISSNKEVITEKLILK